MSFTVASVNENSAALKCNLDFYQRHLGREGKGVWHSAGNACAHTRFGMKWKAVCAGWLLHIKGIKR